MTMILTTVAPPAVEPVFLAEAKEHLRVIDSSEDNLITRLITAARLECELISRRALITQTLAAAFMEWPGRSVKLARPPLQSVVSIIYTDSDGNSGTVSADDYIVDTTSVPGRVWLKANASWPATTLQAGPSIVITYVAGFGDAGSDVPENYRQALLLILGDYYENRERMVVDRGLTPVVLDAVNHLLYIDRGAFGGEFD